MENQKHRGKRMSEEDCFQIHIKNIPDDLVPEIMCKLPARSICRFRCVCKSWRDLFQDKEFITRTRAKPPFKFEIQKNGSLENYTIDERGFAIAKGKNHYIGGCKYRRCNNLICYQSDCDSRIFSVLDLSTQLTHVLPLPPSELKQPYFNFEFGLDPCSNEYKVLVWTHATTGPDFYILTLQGDEEGRSSSNSWRRPLGAQISGYYYYEKTFATTTGMIYLFDGSKLFSYSLSTEKFRIIPLPSKVFERRRRTQPGSWYSLFEYEGCLCWVEISVVPIKPIGCNYWEITGMWMLKDHVDVQWVRLMKEITLPMPMYASSVSTIWSQKHSQFSSTRSGEIMITISGTEFAEDPYVLLYNFLDREFRTIKISIICEDDSDESCEDDDNESYEDHGNKSCMELL